jgi:hypothetical protein
VLPVKLTGTNMGDQMKSSDEVRYIVIHNPKCGYVIPDRSDWKILLCNCDNIFYQKGDNYSSGAPAILDNDVNTYWMYGTNSPYWNDSQYNGDDYNYDFTGGYHAFYGDRNTPGTQVFVIDMKQKRYIMGLGKIDRQDLNGSLKDAEFYVSDDDKFLFYPQKEGGSADDYSKVGLNNWKELFRWQSMPTQNTICWHQLSYDEIQSRGVTALKGRYLKIRIWYGSRGGNNHGSCISEIKVKELKAIDGNPVE